jgi:hypothetical protein
MIAMVRQASDEYPFLLADMTPSQGQKRMALGVVVALLVAFGITAPFANAQLRRVDAFIPILETAIVITLDHAPATVEGQNPKNAPAIYPI